MANLRCPHCQHKIEIQVATPKPLPRPGKRLFESTRPTSLRNEAATIPMPPAYQSEAQSPVFMPTTEANVIVPLLQSLITGVFIALPVGLVVGLIDIKLDNMVIRGSIGSGFLWAGVTLFSVTCWQWITRSNEYNNLLWKIETITGMDVDGDEKVGQPEPPTIRVEVKEGGNWRFANLPGDNESLQKFASDILNGIRTFSEQGANENGYGIDNFKKLRGVFLEKGWAVWNHPQRRQQGVSLTRSGQWVLKEIANTPLPYREVDVQNNGTEIGSSTLHERFRHI